MCIRDRFILIAVLWTGYFVLEGFDFGSIRLAETPPAAVFGLAQHYRLSADDASYLCLAAEVRAPLLTFDATLASAAADRFPPRHPCRAARPRL